MRIIGIMSGTSYDAVDVACADIDHDGDDVVLRPLGSLCPPHDQATRDAIAAVLPPNRTTIEAVTRLDAMLGRAFARAAVRANADLADGRAELVVSHGQTVFHWIEDGTAHGTLQLGRPAWIAEATGLPVVSDLRSADIAAGGQGAPLVPIFDALLLGALDGSDSDSGFGPGSGSDPDSGARAALNLGGIANVTVIAPGRPVIGYDVGPANALIDAACVAFADRPFDRDGSLAAMGTVDDGLLDVLLAEPFYAAEAPKSTGKELFHIGYLTSRLAAAGRSERPTGGEVADVVATLTELTARTVAAELNRHAVRSVVVSGGGTRNPVLTERLRRRLPEHCELSLIDEYGIGVDDKEAYAFALIGYLTWHGIPATIPTVTGASAPRVLGSLNLPLTAPRPPAAVRPAPRRLRIEH